MPCPRNCTFITHLRIIENFKRGTVEALDQTFRDDAKLQGHFVSKFGNTNENMRSMNENVNQSQISKSGKITGTFHTLERWVQYSWKIGK